MKKISEFISSLISKDSDTSTRLKIIVLIGIMAILMLSLPDITNSCSQQDNNVNYGLSNSTQYASMLEEQLEQMISSIEGAGKTQVMVTLQNSIEYIYASEDKTSFNSSENTGSNGSQSSEEKENSENNYIIIKDSSGERALVRTEIMPSVNGVVVICEGADDPVTAERIRSVVTTALNISSKRVCITLLSKEH